MFQSLKSFLKSIITGKPVPAEYLEEFLFEMQSKNMQRLFALTAVGIPLSIVLIYLDKNRIMTGGCKNSMHYCSVLLQVHYVILIYSVIASAGYLTVFKRITNYYIKEFYQLVSLVSSGLLFVLVCYAGFQNHTNPTPYIIGILLLGAVFYLQPVKSVPVFVFLHTVFIYMSQTQFDDQSVLWTMHINTSVTLVFSAALSVSSFRIQKNDFLQRKLIQSQSGLIQEREEENANIFESSPYPKVVTLIPDGTILRVNKAARKYFGIQKMKPDRLVSADYYADIRDRQRLLDELQKKGRLEGFTLKVITAGRKERWVQVAAEKTRIRGRSVLISGFMDITERIDRNEKLLQATRRAERLAESKSEFLANMSHEIRTPMNAILGMSELLEDTSQNEDQKNLIRVIRNAGNNLIHIINDILDVSKLQAGQVRLEKIQFNIKDLINRLEETFRFRHSGKDLSLVFETDEDCPQGLYGDPHRLTQILSNLISNALKFTEKGTVKVTTKCENKDNTTAVLWFEVSDTGIGISEEGKKRLFQRFAQAEDSTTRRYGGTGLGLTITHDLVKLMDGTIDVESETGKGTVFKISIPFQTGDGRLHSGQINILSETVERVLTGKRILVAEDNEDNRLLIKRFLESIDLRLDFAFNGEEAVKLYKQNRYDMVLMDIQMPVMNGYDAAGAIRRYESESAKEPVIMTALTAYAMQADVKKALEYGFQYHLAKPFTRKSLLKIMTQALAGS